MPAPRHRDWREATGPVKRRFINRSLFVLGTGYGGMDNDA